MKNTSAIILLFLLTAFSLNANNVKITNVALKNDSTLTFKVSWENSWRIQANPGNWDAVWIFIKWEECAVPTQWNHLKLKNSGYYAAPPLEAKMPADRVGIMLQRSGYGNGNIVNDSVAVQFNLLGAGAYNFRVFGIEMVYVPQDSFYLGDMQNVDGMFHKHGGTNGTPFLVNNDTIPVGASNGRLSSWQTGGGGWYSYTGNVNRTLPNTYPNGYGAVYCMKYEITRAEWVAFMNTLTNAQSVAMRPDYYNTAPTTANPQYFRILGSYPSHTTDYPYRAADGLDYLQSLSYLDWCGLRPMTELEYEKIARGRQFPVPMAYPWGNTLSQQTTSFINWKSSSEKMNNSVPNGYGAVHAIHNFGGTDSLATTVRGGFNGSTGSTRLTIGAGYWGVLELAGNQREGVVPLLITSNSGNRGLNFRFNKYSHGDGNITAANGYYNDTNWVNTFGTPGSAAATSISNPVGLWFFGVRGGKYNVNTGSPGLLNGTGYDEYQISYREFTRIFTNSTNGNVNQNWGTPGKYHPSQGMLRGLRTANF